MSAVASSSREDIIMPEESNNATMVNSFCRFLFLSHKATDILTLAAARDMLPNNFPHIESFNLCHINTESEMDDLLERENANHESDESKLIIVVRLLGRGTAGWKHLLDLLHFDVMADAFVDDAVQFSGQKSKDPDHLVSSISC